MDQLPMSEPAMLAYYASHSALSDPRAHARLIGGLPPDIATLCGVLQGLLIHEAWIERQGFDAAAFSGQSRATLPVSERLDQLFAIDPRPLTHARAGECRALATCRDFALMLCAALRQHGVPARVRCGFATYFAGHPYHDHWVCEYWARDRQCWVLVDAEIDEPHRKGLPIDFEPTDVPRTAFITGIEAWKRCRSGAMNPEHLGHGTTTGLFFARVNLARDLLALAKSETSPWDSWRAARDPYLQLNEAALSSCDDLAQRGEEGAVEIAQSLHRPPWQ
jgi:hypothetical protein